MNFAGIRLRLAVITGVLLPIIASCGTGKGDKATDTDSTTVNQTIALGEAYDSVECQRLLDLNYDIQNKDLESLVTQCEALISPLTEKLYGAMRAPKKDGKTSMEDFHAIRSSKPMMYATQLAGFLYLAQSLENVPEDLRKRARRQDELASELQAALNSAMSEQSNFDPGVDDEH